MHVRIWTITSLFKNHIQRFFENLYIEGKRTRTILSKFLHTRLWFNTQRIRQLSGTGVGFKSWFITASQLKTLKLVPTAAIKGDKIVRLREVSQPKKQVQLITMYSKDFKKKFMKSKNWMSVGRLIEKSCTSQSKIVSEICQNITSGVSHPCSNPLFKDPFNFQKLLFSL